MNAIDLTRIEVLIGTGGIGTGMFFELEGDHTLTRNESRVGILRDWRDYCKLHIVLHYFAMLRSPQSAAIVRILPVGKVGDDAVGAKLLEQMAAAGMEVSYVGKVTDAPTLFSVSFIYPDRTGGNITASNSASGRVSPDDIGLAEEVMAVYEGKGIAVSLPEVSLRARVALLALATRHRLFRSASFTVAEMDEVKRGGLLKEVDLLTINHDEADALAGGVARAGQKPVECGSLRDALTEVIARVNPDLRLCLTMGAAGSWAFWRGTWEYIPPAHVKSVNTAGAGDAYLAGVLTGLVNGRPFIRRAPARRENLAEGGISTACDYGSMVAGLSTMSPRTIHPDLSIAMVREYALANGIQLDDYSL